MKLTLRTLLAFLDETVSQDDAAALRKKIKESKAIRELIERIRRVVSQPQLPAPHQSGKGLDANPNYPCEYIDSTLDPEKVAEFEKRAISSDPLLAEIAEAHQILAQLSEIDEGVSGRLRNRLYKTTESIYRTNSEEPEMFPVIEDHASIQEEYEDAPEPPRSKPGFDLSPPSQPASHSDSRSQFSDIPPVQPPPVVANPSPDRQFSIDARSDQTGRATKTPPGSRKALEVVPSGKSGTAATAESTHSTSNAASRASMLPVILATASVTTLFVLIVVSFINRGNWQTAVQDTGLQNGKPQGELATSQAPLTTGDLEAAAPEGPSARPTEGDQPVHTEPATDKSLQGQPTAKDGDTEPDRDGSKTVLKPGKNLLKQNRPADTDKASVPGENKKAETGKDAGQEKDEYDGIVNLFKDKDYDKKKKTGDPPSELTGPGKKKMDATKSKTGNPADKGEPGERLTDTRELMAEAVSLTNGPAIGVMKSALEPTLRKTNLPEARWICLAQENPVHINDTLVTLPGSHSKIEILDSVRIHLDDYSVLEFQQNPGKILPKLILKHGIITLENLKDPNNTIDVQAGTANCQLTFVDKASRVSVLHYNPPAEKKLPPVIQFATVKGRAIIKRNADVVSLEQRERMQLEGPGNRVDHFQEMPKILTEKSGKLTTAAKELFFAISLENPVFEIAFSKALSDKRPYLRMFTMESGMVMGEFQPFVSFLKDPENRSFWQAAVLSFRKQVFLDAALYQKAKSHFETMPSPNPQQPDLGTRFFQSITTLSDQELDQGKAMQLVNSLASPVLFVRVGGIQTLYALTGKTKFFRPEEPPAKSRKWIKAWEKSLEKEEIRVSSPFQPPHFQ